MTNDDDDEDDIDNIRYFYMVISSYMTLKPKTILTIMMGCFCRKFRFRHCSIGCKL